MRNNLKEITNLMSIMVFTVVIIFLMGIKSYAAEITMDAVLTGMADAEQVDNYNIDITVNVGDKAYTTQMGYARPSEMKKAYYRGRECRDNEVSLSSNFDGTKDYIFDFELGTNSFYYSGAQLSNDGDFNPASNIVSEKLVDAPSPWGKIYSRLELDVANNKVEVKMVVYHDMYATIIPNKIGNAPDYKEVFKTISNPNSVVTGDVLEFITPIDESGLEGVITGFLVSDCINSNTYFLDNEGLFTTNSDGEKDQPIDSVTMKCPYRYEALQKPDIIPGLDDLVANFNPNTKTVELNDVYDGWYIEEGVRAKDSFTYSYYKCIDDVNPVELLDGERDISCQIMGYTSDYKTQSEDGVNYYWKCEFGEYDTEDGFKITSSEDTPIHGIAFWVYFDWPVQDDIKVEIEFEDNVPSDIQDQMYSFVGVSYDTDGQVAYATYPRDYLPIIPMADILMTDEEPFIIKSIRVTPSSLQVLVPDLNTNRFTLNEEGTYIAKASILNVGGIINVDAYTEPFTIVKTSSSKSYKAKDINKTAEKISGSNKKGSKKTITPQEGRKVSEVKVLDKNGNKVDVTLNEDGTYSFIQPASDVTVEVVYKNREIVLNIGSTDAYVDDELNKLDVTPVIKNDRTMLPIRFVAENLGAKVEWDEKNLEYVLITKGDIKIEITLGSDKAKVNGKEFTLDSVAFAENDRTYLPVRFVSEHLNAIVEWNESKPMEVKIYER